MNKEDISLIINCKKENIENIDISLFQDQYSKIYFNINKNIDAIINILQTKYYSIWDYNKKYRNINKLKVYQIKSRKIDISILIPVYNCEKYIKKCLDSCLLQDFTGNYEIVIVDDGSTDNTILLIQEYNDNRIKLYCKDHSGISDTLNYGLSKCRGKYICRMDADDIMYANRLTYQYNYLENNHNVDILCSNIDRYLQEDNNLIIYNNGKELELIKQNISINDLFNEHYHYNFICHPAICFKKELYDYIIKIDGYFYDHKFDLAEDYELYCRLIKYHKLNITTDKCKVLQYTVKLQSQDKLNKINQLRNELYYLYNDNFTKLTIGIYYIATNIYKNDFDRFLLSIKNFFPENKKTIILISDGLDNYDNYIDEIHNINIIVKHINDYPWPINTLFKMKYIYDNIINADYIFYFNANCEILPIKSYKWFDVDNLIFAYHKDWFNNNCNPCVFCEPYMDNPNSTSYIGTTNYTYIQGAFFGGPSKKLYQMCKSINEMIQIDLQNNIIPRYHDETYLNKYNYLYNNACISKVLISEIWYDKNNLHNIEDTQFILMHENIYNIKQNNKVSKFDYVIPHNQLHPLYNYDNIFEYIDKYPNHKIDNKYDNKHNIILFYIKTDISSEELELILFITKSLFNYYELIILHDSRVDKFILEQLYTLYDSEHIFGIDIMSLINMYQRINSNNLYFYGEQIMNLLIKNNYWFNLFNSKDFNSLYIINNVNLFKETINLILNINDTSDLLVNNYNIYNINGFVVNDYVKKYNLFQYKYKFKNQLFCDLDNFKISHNALDFLYNFKNEIKLTIPQYYIPTLLYNNGYNIQKYNK